MSTSREDSERDAIEKREANRREWFVALGLAVALHAVAIVGLGALKLPAPASEMPEPVDLVILPEGADPQSFVEQPADRAEAESENPDFVSNVTSQARDLAPGGDDALPRAQGDVNAPMVKLDRNQSSSPSQTQSTDAPKEFGLESPQPKNNTLFPGPPGSAGNSDIQQPEMDNPDGNAGLSGDVSLSTTEWNYSPWLQRFGRELMRRWIAPPAYTIGLLKEGGWAQIDMEIARSGKVLRVELRDQQGHQTLILAAQSAVRSMNPCEPLPADFPDQTLVLRIKMVYPKYSEVSRRRTR